MTQIGRRKIGDSTELDVSIGLVKLDLFQIVFADLCNVIQEHDMENSEKHKNG